MNKLKKNELTYKKMFHEQDKLRQLAPELVFKTQQIQLLNQSRALMEYEAIRRPREALTAHFVLDIKIKKKATENCN